MFDVERYWNERKALIDSALMRYLMQKRRYPRGLLQAMRYGIFAGGKRIRPILTLASGEVFGAQKNSLLLFAYAHEFIHAYSLIHDDLLALDDDGFPRCELSNHKVFREGTALLAEPLPAIARYDLERKA